MNRSLVDSQAKLRTVMRARRRALTALEQQQAALGVARQLAQTRMFQRARRIAFYLPNDGEIDPTEALSRAWDVGKQCYLPVISRLSWDRLWFAPVQPDTPLVINRFGIPEPALTPRAMVRAGALDLVLMPLVAFDVCGNRVGMGGGFYDRSLAFLSRRNHWRRPRLIGLAHELQRVDRMNPNPWDIPLDAVATDAACYFTQRI